MSVEEIDEVLGACRENPLLWGMYFLSNHFRSESPAFHLKVVREAMSNRYLAIAAPRGSAKSTILTLLMPMHSIVFKRKRFILLCQNTYQKAARSLENIKKEFRENGKLKDFGIVIVKDSEGDSIFRSLDGFETRVLCKGAEQLGSVRGEKFGAWRPDLILVDDLEDDELVRNPDRRRVLKEAFDEALIPAGDKDTVDVVVIGTILHDDSLMAKFVSEGEYTEYRKLVYRALVNGKSIWPQKWSVEDLKKIEREKPHVFAKEYQNDPVISSTAYFKREYFQYWSVENGEYICFDDDNRIVRRGSFRECKAAIGVDLAWEEKRESDFTAIVPVYLTPESDLLVDNYICKKGVRENEFCEIIFTMEDKMRILTGNVVPVGMEKAKQEKIYKHFLRREMQKRNRFISTRDVKWDTDKIMRISTRLSTRYEQKVVYHRRGMGELELQLMRFPSAAHDDLPDALGNAVSLLEYPKSKAKETVVDNEFEWLRKKAIEARGMGRPKNLFSNGGKKYTFLNTQESYR